jgi:galactonate dehydratase
LKIARIEAFKVPPRWVFIRVESDEGAVGWGEASLEGHAEAIEGAVAALTDRLVGADPFRIEDAWQIGYRGGFYRGGAVLMSALSGLDQALWDLKGKALAVPVWELLGGKVRDFIEVYSWIGGDRPDDVANAAKVRREQGFRTVKMNATAELRWLDSPTALDAAVARAEAVKSAGVDVGIDFHGRLHKAMAKQLAARLEAVRPLFIEEPLLSEEVDGLEQLSKMTTVPIALGERLFSRWDCKPFFERGIVDIIQPDLSHAGGISEVRRIAAMAEAYDVGVAPHCPLGPLALASCFQIAACTPNFVLQEMSIGIHYNSPAHDLLTYLCEPSVFAVTDGAVQTPQGSGLGVSIDEAAVREASRDAKAWRNPIWRNADGSLTEW